MMRSAEAGKPQESLVQLRHRLRTPLNHIAGYSEMLLDEAEGDWPDAVEGLRQVIANARAMLQSIQECLAEASGSHEGGRAKKLCAALQKPLHDTARICGALASTAPEGNLLDLLRIDTAVAELLHFVAGETDEQSPVSNVPTASNLPAKPGNCVLVVDDDEINRDILCRQLEKLGYSVILARSGAEALAKLKASKVDVALVDMMMPGMSGLDLLEALKADYTTQHIPVIMISALDDLADVSRSIERGAQDYLFKPSEPVLLQSRIGAALERTKLLAHERERTEVLEQMSRELRRSNEELNTFAYSASHDLQSPLRTVMTHLQLLKRRLGGQLSPDDAKVLGFAVDAAKRMSQLISALLAYSQASTHQTDLQPVSCEEVINSTVSDLAALIAEARAVISHDPLPVVMADAVQLRQLLLNLVGNAIKYRKEDEAPKVHVSAAYEDAAWHFSVKDNGEGIEPEYLAEVFKMFRRLHGQERPGTGLGLAICDRIVQRLNGKLWVESQPGVGSVFHFTIPGPFEIPESNGSHTAL